MKKIIALLLALTLIASVFAVTVSAESVPGDSAVVNLYTFGVNIESKNFSVGDEFTVYTSLDLADINDGKVSGLAGIQTFDPSVLSLTDETDEYGLIKDTAAMLPVAGSFGMAGYNGNGTLKFNASNPALNGGFSFNSPDSYLVISTYKVIAPGTVDINTGLTTLALSDFELTRVINKSEFKSPYTSDQVTMTSAFDEYTEPAPVLNGLVDGYYYIDGELAKGKGLVEFEDAIYFVKNDGSIYTNGTLKVVEAKTNGLAAAGSYSFDKDGKLIDVKKIVKGYYYVNGKKAPGAGVVEYNGNFYFVKNNAAVYTSGRLSISEAKTNGLLPAGAYNFDENGKLLCNGVINGYFYIDGDKAKGAGVVEYGGNLYFAKNDGTVYKNGRLSVSEAKTNGLVAAGAYNFDADGKMQDVKRIVKGYYYVNGKKVPSAGLVEYNGNLYFIKNNAAVYTSGYLYVTKAKANDLVPEGRYQFDGTGKMVR